MSASTTFLKCRKSSMKMMKSVSGTTIFMRAARSLLVPGWVGLAALGVASIYVALPRGVVHIMLAAAGLAIVAGTAAYLMWRPAARRIVWPPRKE
jgi:hypothetical protein